MNNLQAVVRAFYGDTRAQIKSASTPEAQAQVVKGIHDRFDSLFAGGLISSRATIACRAGCSLCCHFKVDVWPQEVFAIVDFIKSNFTPEQIENVRQRATANSKKIAPMSARQHLATNLMCPLLQDGMCSVYPVRPLNCRKFHSKTLATCQNSFDHPNELLGGPQDDEVPELTSTLGNHYMAVKLAYQEEGYDARPYDLSRSLAFALDNPNCANRWMKKKPAFPDAVVAKDYAASVGL